MKFVSVVLLILIYSASARAATVAELYQSYQQHINDNELIEALDVIESAFQLSRTRLGIEHNTTQTLALNYAQLYVKQREVNRDYQPELAIDLLKGYLDYVSRNEVNELDKIDPYMTLGIAYLWYPLEDLKRKSEFRNKVRRFGGDRLTQSRTSLISKAKSNFSKALSIAVANSEKYPLLEADLKFEIAKYFFENGVEFKLAAKYLEDSFGSYDNQVEKDDVRRIMTAFWLGRAKQESGDLDSSNKYFLIVVQAYQDLELFNHSRLKQALEHLVDNYSAIGNNNKAAEYEAVLDNLKR